MAIDKQESVLFDETDRETEEEKVTFADRPSNKAQKYSGRINDSMNGSIASNDSSLNTTIKPVKLVDKSRRAFSLSIDSSKAFELALRKPRNKWKHKVTRCRGDIYGIYLMLMKHHGSPPGTKDLNWIFTLYSACLALDIMMLINFTMHIFTPLENFQMFGWAFMLTFLAIPYLSAYFAIIAAILGSDTALKATNNMNSMMIMFNIPITGFLSMWNQDDPVYLLLLALMVCCKIALSALGAKVRMFLVNPRYSKNKAKLLKILSRQNQKLQVREQILGKETVEQLEGVGSSNSTLSTGLLESTMDTRKMRDKLIEEI